ncbi:MAG: hypothetical protein ACKV19_29045 [Verrucomicrobiales bacterium]
MTPRQFPGKTLQRVLMYRLICTLVTVAPCFAFAGGLVWSDRPSGTRSIKASGFDGSDRRTLYSSAGDPRGVIIDAESERVFFTDRFGGTATSGEINSVPLTGGARAQHLSGLNRPADLRLDAATRTLYWCEENAGLIRRAHLPLAAGILTAESLITGVPNPYYLDFDPIRSLLVWGSSGNSLQSGPLTGGSANPPLYSAGQNMRGVCVDSTAGMVYWVERDGPRAIRRRALDGGSIEDLYTGLDTPHGLVLDLPARRMYWVDTGSQNAGGFNARGVSRGHMDGQAREAAEVVVAGTPADQPWDVDLDPRVANYAEWQARFFRFDASAVLTDPAADPDEDGLISFGEYAFGQSPLLADGDGMVVPTMVTVDFQIYPAITFPQRAEVPDVAYAVSLSMDLISWSASGDGTIEVGHSARDSQGMQRVTVRSTTAATGAPRQFFQVRASRVTPP